MSKTTAMSDGDLYVAPSGQLMEINETTKGEQDFAEEFLTEYIPEEDYGNEIFSLVGKGDISGPDVSHTLTAISSQKISDVVSRLQAQQQLDFYSTPDERIGGISRLLVNPDPNFPSNILYYVELITESGTIILGDKGFVVSNKQAEPSSRVEIEAMLEENPPVNNEE